MRVYAYLRASTKEQDASRAKQQLIDFADSLGLEISAFFIENESGAKLQRPELFRLLDIAHCGDVILLEQIDRISRLSNEDWLKLKNQIQSRRIRIVSVDLPTSHNLLSHSDEFTGWVLDAINNMLLDMLAAVARKDYVNRRRMQKQGIQKAKENGRYKGRPKDTEKRERIKKLLESGTFSWTQIQDTIDCSRGTIAAVAKELNSEAK